MLDTPCLLLLALHCFVLYFEIGFCCIALSDLDLRDDSATCTFWMLGLQCANHLPTQQVHLKFLYILKQGLTIV